MNDDVRANYETVCSELNIDEVAKDSAWQEYQAINNDYVLEGPHIEWLACALYIACRSTVTKTVEGDEYAGNSISLTQILRATKLRLIEFFRKIKKWLEMAKLPPVYLEKVEALERKFEVISVIFNKYTTEYSMLFVPRDHSQLPLSGGGSSSRPRSRKPNKAKPCSSLQLFQFGWVLYIHIKNQFPLISDDLVNSHYLLLCCLDMLCAAVISMKRKDLLNSSFDGFPDDYESPSSLEFPHVLSELCKKFAAIEKECLVVRDYYWWPSVRRLYETHTLHWTGSLSNIELYDVLQSLLSPSSFQSNLKSLNHVYELTVLQEGDFDERVFLNNPSDMECYNQEQRDFEHGDNTSAPPGIIYQSPQHLQYGTPLTGREYLSSKDSKLTPVSDANQSVIQLHLLLEGYTHSPSDELIKICSCCHNNPMNTIDTRLQEMSQKFLHSLKADSVLTPDNFAVVRLQLSQSLYYKLLTAIVCDEEKKMAGSSLPARSAGIQNMLEHDIFQHSLFALCVEIVLFSYNSHSRIFPWILSIIEVSPFHFYKVIEVAIKVETGFPRTVIKHMSKIEESVLSSLAWKTGSPLFEMLEKVGSIPCYSDVALPDSPISGLNSPLTSRVKLSASKDLSPLSIRERYSSPVPSVSRRQLFTGKRPPKSPAAGASSFKVPLPIAPKPPQGKVRVTRLNPIQNNAAAATAALINLIQQTSPQKPPSDPIMALQAILAKTSPDKKPMKDEVKTSNGQENLPKITVTDTPQKTLSSPLPPTRQQPKRTGSVALFYRKVYQMSFLRIKDLCERLDLDSEMLQKAWTCFEYSLMRSPDLMRDRHIDQLIMCSIYVVAKVLRKEVTFQEIMRQYRHQPQAKSHVYRSVLLNSSRSRKLKSKMIEQKSENEELMDIATASSTTSDVIGGTSPDTTVVMDTKAAVARDSTDIDAILFKNDIEEGTRGDIIQFYNKIFIGFVKDYVLKFTPDPETQSVPSCSMSPLPLIKRAPVSPRKVSKNHPIFVSPLKGTNQSSMSPLAKTFVVSKSPASDLFELNQVVGSSSHGARIGARRQLDALLSRSPVVSSLAQRPCLEVNNNNSRHAVPSSITRIHPMDTENNNTVITTRTCNGSSMGNNNNNGSSLSSSLANNNVHSNHT